MQPFDARLTIMLTAEERERLVNMARAQNRTVSGWVRSLLRDAMEVTQAARRSRARAAAR